MVQNFGDSCTDSGCWNDSFDVSYHQNAIGRSLSIQSILVKNSHCSGNNLSEGERWWPQMIKASFGVLDNLKSAILELKKLRHDSQVIDNKLDELLNDCGCTPDFDLSEHSNLEQVCNYSDHQQRLKRWRRAN